MKTLKELLAEKSAKKAAGKAALAKYNAIAAKTERTAEEVTQFTALETELNNIEAAVDELDLAIVEAETRERRSSLFSDKPGDRALALTAGRVLNEPDPALRGGFNNLAEMALSIRSAVTGGGIDDRLVKLAAAPGTFNSNQGSGNEGFLVPTDFKKTIWDMALDNYDFLGMVGPEPTASNTVLQPKDETTPWGATGVQAYWAAEAGQLNLSKAALTGELMQLHKLYAFVAATEELLADAPMLNDRLTRQAGKAIKWKASDAIMWGTGVGQPTGFQTAPSLIVVAKDAGQATATLTISNVVRMMARVLRTGGRPLWIANQDIIPQLATLTLGNAPAWLPNNQPLQASPFEGSLMGYPVIFTEHAQTLGSQGDLTCANLDGYYAATKADGGLDFASSIHLFFDTANVAFRWQFRLAGQPYLSKPVAPAHGTNTKSHFVTLAARP